MTLEEFLGFETKTIMILITEEEKDNYEDLESDHEDEEEEEDKVDSQQKTVSDPSRLKMIEQAKKELPYTFKGKYSSISFLWGLSHTDTVKVTFLGHMVTFQLSLAEKDIRCHLMHYFRHLSRTACKLAG